MKKIFFLLLYCIMLCAREEEIEDYIVKGNFALPTSQEPAPLFCFGQAIIDKGDLQAFAYVSSLLGKKTDFTQVIPLIFYGITDELTLTIGQPIAAKFKFNNSQSSGIGDFVIQGEYAFYNKDRPTYADQATIIANMTFPCGSLNKNPPTGFGSPTFLLGATAGHMSIDWYIFACFGGIITTPHNSDKFSNTLLYQWGFGKNLHYVPHKRIVTALLEFFGSYTNSSQIRGPHYKNFDDNNFFIGPSLWVSTKRFTFNPGIAFSLYSNKKDPGIGKILISAEVGWTFK
jgi:hypothetical protein